MATFLELCQGVRLMSGAQGVGPLTVLDTSGYEQALVHFVQDAYRDIQNSREDFRFLRETLTFNTVIGQQEYAPPVTASDIKSYIDGTLIVEDGNGKKQLIRKLEYDVAEQRYLNNETNDVTQYYAITPADTIKLYPAPNGLYPASMDYQQNPEELITDAQVPKLPLSLHSLIGYKALQKFSVFLGVPEVYREYSQEAARLMQKLMSLQIPEKRMRAPRFIV